MTTCRPASRCPRPPQRRAPRRPSGCSRRSAPPPTRSPSSPPGRSSNIAALVAADPAVTDAVRRLVVLGGAYRQRGVTPHAERNVWCDPEAAHDVFTGAFREILLITMDATFSAPLTGVDVTRLRSTGTPAAQTAADLLEERIAWYRRDEAMLALNAAPLHDPLAVACLVDPGVVDVRRTAVTVERTDPVTYGATRFAFSPDSCAGSVVSVALRAHRDRYVDLLVRTLGDSAR
ncbi:nucleoside hydrolase [Nocardioides sp. TF02-7]|uniref:nucleoside hydrolase n=1 Tax=Nocardioides sp. TF02-7 TaxID=2917724 RepID=UPI0023DABF70|nr:nucleoside hydrolase [Nocardioides sp. TF02-7]